MAVHTANTRAKEGRPKEKIWAMMYCTPRSAFWRVTRSPVRISQRRSGRREAMIAHEANTTPSPRKLERFPVSSPDVESFVSMPIRSRFRVALVVGLTLQVSQSRRIKTTTYQLSLIVAFGSIVPKDLHPPGFSTMILSRTARSSALRTSANAEL
jgi:hypothetical protein